MYAIAVLLLCGAASATINVATFPNTAFSGPPVVTVAADLSALTVPAFSSVRVEGMLTPSHADLLLLSVAPLSAFSGWLLLWLDDHLVLDTAQRGLVAPLNVRFGAKRQHHSPYP